MTPQLPEQLKGELATAMRITPTCAYGIGTPDTARSRGPQPHAWKGDISQVRRSRRDGAAPESAQSSAVR